MLASGESRPCSALDACPASSRDLAIPGQLNEVPAALGRGGAAYAADHLKVHEDVLGEGGFGIVFILQQRAEVAYEYTKATPIGCRTLFRLFFVFFNICN